MLQSVESLLKKKKNKAANKFQCRYADSEGTLFPIILIFSIGPEQAQARSSMWPLNCRKKKDIFKLRFNKRLIIH